MLRLLSFLVLSVASGRFLKDALKKLSPAEIAEQLRQQTNSPKTMVDVAKLDPSCGSVDCADMSTCTPNTGLEIVWNEGQCCPVCTEAGYVPGKPENEGKYIVEHWQGAHPTCRDVKCFQLVCPNGAKPKAPSGGGCCLECKA